MQNDHEKIPKRRLLPLAALLFGIVLIIGITVYLSNPSTRYMATEISAKDLPDGISEKMNQDVQTGGAYFYTTGEKNNVSYVLLTFGKQLDLDMNVDISNADNGLHFSVNAIETARDEQYVFKLYKTNAPSISADQSILKNPRLVVGAKGINFGFLTPINGTSEYQILPLEDDGTDVRTYSYNGDESFTQGLYRFSFQMTQNGVELLSASPVDQYAKSGYVTSIDADKATAEIVLAGNEKIVYNMGFDKANETLVQALEELLSENDSRRGLFTFHYDTNADVLMIDRLDVL